MTFLSGDQLTEFSDLGYLVVPDVLGLLDAVGRVTEEYDKALDELLSELRSSGDLILDIPTRIGICSTYDGSLPRDRSRLFPLFQHRPPT